LFSVGVFFFAGDEDATLGNHVIMEMKPTGEIALICGTPGQRGHLDSIGSASKFDWPVGMALNRRETELYVADCDNQVIRAIDLQTHAVRTLCGVPGVAGFRDGAAAQALFSSPIGLAVDADDNLYISDLHNRVIRKLSFVSSGKQHSGHQRSAAMVSTFAGAPGVDGHRDGVADEARFLRPKFMTIDRLSRMIYVADAECIRKVELATRAVGTLCGHYDEPGYVDSMNGAEVRFDETRGLAIDSSSLLLVSDFFNDCIRLVDTNTGSTWTLAGRSHDDNNVITLEDVARLHAAAANRRATIQKNREQRLLRFLPNLVEDDTTTQPQQQPTNRTRTASTNSASSTTSTSSSSSSTSSPSIDTEMLDATSSAPTATMTPATITPTSSTTTPAAPGTVATSSVTAAGAAIAASARQNGHGLISSRRPSMDEDDDDDLDDDFDEDDDEVTFADGDATTARFNSPTGVAIHPVTGDVFVNVSVLCGSMCNVRSDLIPISLAILVGLFQSIRSTYRKLRSSTAAIR
jgi:hypothetical protein